VGPISPTERAKRQEEGYQVNDFIGKSGLELSYETELHGVHGQEQIEVNAFGKPVKFLGSIPPQAGASLILNIDKELQEQLYENFKKNSGNVKGAAIALNPKTGEVLALLSVPGFDNNLFAHGITTEQYKALLEDTTLPLFNRAISGTYPPGSTVKPMVALAALEEGIVSETTEINDKGVLIIPNQFNPKQSYNFYGWDRNGIGPVNIKSAIAKSSDIYFYTVAGGHPNSPIQGLGIQRLSDYYRKFNLGKPTGIDLVGEKSGVVADPAWKANYFKKDAILAKWYLGDTYHVGIGQGDMLVTPLQVAEWTAAIANNGVGMKPKIVRQILDADGQVKKQFNPEVLIPKVANDENLKIVQQGMRETNIYGSGSQLATLAISSAGKSGTSQFDSADPLKTHAWFAAYAPFEDPEIVVTVLVEAGGAGFRIAVPIVKDTFAWWAEHRYNK
jgi:penicillin-binding protein 2